ncbi:hypothetical protein RISW2_22915 [Roseivivax isoporae LMG 25204]|uniref:Uncharacterized protein n=1 Tax=Roseivivax isoporae LMG 25204 TaxID=1449351 RepID=X7F0Y6_9RHOB|nr:hypothetical protein RISW2_22915 [Roseivivax isoporae LMG 25204]
MPDELLGEFAKKARTFGIETELNNGCAAFRIKRGAGVG